MSASSEALQLSIACHEVDELKPKINLLYKIMKDPKEWEQFRENSTEVALAIKVVESSILLREEVGRLNGGLDLAHRQWLQVEQTMLMRLNAVAEAKALELKLEAQELEKRRQANVANPLDLASHFAMTPAQALEAERKDKEKRELDRRLKAKEKAKK